LKKLKNTEKNKMQLKIEKKNKKVKKKDRAQANKPASAQANLSREPLTPVRELYETGCG